MLLLHIFLVVERLPTTIGKFMECAWHILLSQCQMHCLFGIIYGKGDVTTKLHVFIGTKISSPGESDQIVR